jgi:succinate dehydrogenase hydrophobic anchor subunit
MAGTILVILTVLFVAPLVLGSYVVVQRSGRLARAWFGFLTALFVVALLIGALALLSIPL